MLRHKLIFIEGNIGSGKTTLVNSLKSIAETNETFFVMEEPVEKWRTVYIDDSGKNILELFYENMSRYSFQFEVIIMITRYRRIVEALRLANMTGQSCNIVIERSLLTDRMCFAENLKDEGHMDSLDWKIYVDWFDTFMSAVEPMFENLDVRYLYLLTPADVCFQRMNERGRGEESSVPISYLKLLEKKHNDWIQKEILNGGMIVGGEQTKDEILGHVRSFLNV